MTIEDARERRIRELMAILRAHRYDADFRLRPIAERILKLCEPPA